MSLTSRLRNSLAAHINFGHYSQLITDIKREQSHISRKLGTNAEARKVDISTPRLPILKKVGDGPVIEPSGPSWMSGSVFDGRPIKFKNRSLIYFCGQPSYRSDSANYVGLAEWINDTLIIDQAPVLWPDIEDRGVDIPAFTVWGDRIVAIYNDDSGPKRTGVGHDTSLFIATSDDGRVFEKTRIDTPFGPEWTRIGLPWLLSDNSRLWVYWRGKKGQHPFLVRTELSNDLRSFVGPIDITPLPRNPINVSVTKRGNTFLHFYGSTIAGGLYVSPSTNGINCDFDKETMLIGENGNEWGWDFSKICASPDNSTNDIVDICYCTSGNSRMCVGMAQFDVRLLEQHWKNTAGILKTPF